MSGPSRKRHLLPTEEELRGRFSVEDGDSVSVKYNRFLDDPEWRDMYRDLGSSFHRPFVTDSPGDWGSASILCTFLRYLDPGSKVLDLGCGTGWPTFWIAPVVAEVVGVDASEVMVGLARGAQKSIWLTPNVEFAVEQGEKLSFSDGSFDAVVMDAVLEWTTDGSRVLREIRRVLKTDGLLINKTTNWVNAVDRDFSALGTRMVLYPSEEKSLLWYGEELVYRYRVCSLTPMEERYYYCQMDTEHPSVAKFLNEQPPQSMYRRVELEQAVEAIRKVQYYVTKQHDPSSLRTLLEDSGFRVDGIHGGREVATKFAWHLEQEGTLRKMTKDFDQVVSALTECVILSDAERSVDIITVARVC